MYYSFSSYHSFLLFLLPFTDIKSGLLSLPLTLLHQSVETGTFPALLKFAGITPVHKSGPDNDPKSYRPISYPSVFSEVFETLMKTTKELLKKTLLNLVSNAVATLLKQILLLLVAINFLFYLFSSISLTFDTANHRILPDKMHHYGIRAGVLPRFVNYLSTRHQHAVIKGEVMQFPSHSRCS